jgi:hypothetical protein
LVSGAELSHSERGVGAPIGAQDTDQPSEEWRSGYQDSGNELSKYIATSKVNLNENLFYEAKYKLTKNCRN